MRRVCATFTRSAHRTYPHQIDREERNIESAGDPDGGDDRAADTHGTAASNPVADEDDARDGQPPISRRLEAALWLIGLGAAVALLGACALPASAPRTEIPGLTGPTLFADGLGYWVVVGTIVLALLTVEAVVRRNRAWLAIVALGAAATVAALLPAIAGLDPLPAPAPYPSPRLLADPGPGLWTLALAGPCVAAGGLLLRRR
jgi:hypothetical protein